MLIFSGSHCHKFSFSSHTLLGRSDPSTLKCPQQQPRIEVHTSVSFFNQMPLEADDQARVDEAIRESGSDPTGHRILVLDPADSQKLGPGTVICTILNRIIGLHPQFSQHYRAVAEILPSARVWYLCHTSHSVAEYRECRGLALAMVLWYRCCHVWASCLARTGPLNPQV